jgi:hypothetical protein
MEQFEATVRKMTQESHKDKMSKVADSLPDQIPYAFVRTKGEL